MSKFGRIFLDGHGSPKRKKAKKPREEQFFFCEESAPALRIFDAVQEDDGSGTPPVADMGPVGLGFRMNTLCQMCEGRSSFEPAETKSSAPVREKTAAGRVLTDGSPVPVPAGKKAESSACSANGAGELEAKLREKSRKLTEANLRIGRMQKQINSLPGFRDKIRQKDECISSLKIQVKQLEAKNRAMEKIVMERDNFEIKCREKDAEIEKLNAMLALYEARFRNPGVTTYLTDPMVIHSSLFDHMTYRVYLSPGKRTLRFIPDDNGTVVCSDRDVTIPAIAGFSRFSETRALEARKEGSEILISLA